MSLLLTAVSPFHPPVIFLSGMIAALLYKRWLFQRNPDWYLLLGVSVVGVAWLQVLLQTVTVPWILPYTLVDSTVLVLFYALSYPFWFWTGGWLLFVLFGKRPEEGGILWLYRIDDRTADYSPPWDSPETDPTETFTADSDRSEE